MLDSTSTLSAPRVSSIAPGIFSQPAEFALHESVWLAWPSHADLWKEDLEPAREEFIAFCRTIADMDPALHRPRGERLDILVPNQEQEILAREALGRFQARFHVIPFGDIWLRDTAPVFVHAADGSVVACRFGFNGWGGKFILPCDDEVAGRIAAASRLRSVTIPWIMEGGSLEVDGEGTCITTRQCLLNPNRNRGLTEKDVEAILAETIGARKVLWLDEGLQNDHTDGHIDTLARFAWPGTVLCMEPNGADDPNAEVLRKIIQQIESFTDARGRRLRLIRVPSPGRVLANDGERVMPASYLNFYIGNTSVIVPTYGSKADEAAVAAIAVGFPGRKTIGLPSKAILTGGGAFHRMSQQQPIARPGVRA